LKARIVVDSVDTNDGCVVPPTFSGAICNSPFRRSTAGKSSLAPEKFGSSTSGGLSIIDRCAGGSASIDWGRPSAFSSANLLCRAGKYPENADHLRPPASDPTERDQSASARAPACQ